MIKEKKDYRLIIETLGVISVVPTGTSMLPFIVGEKDVVVVEKPSRPLTELDAVLYQTDSGDFILHRIVKIEEDGFIVIGDNQDHAQKIAKDSVIGVLTAIYKGEKKIDVLSEKYRKKIENWYKNPKKTQAKRKRRQFLFKVKNKLKRIFRG